MQSDAPFDDGTIADVLRAHWEVEPLDVTYAQVGYGSWHWHVHTASHRRLFVTLDQVDTELKATCSDLRWAYGVPLALENVGLEIARAPLSTTAGDVLVSAGANWAASVWPFIEGRATHDGTYSSAEDAAAVRDIVHTLHGVPLAAVGGEHQQGRRETFRVGGVAALLRLVDEEWAGPYRGPHAEAGARLLHQHASDIHRLANRYDELVLRAPPVDEWVLTHGEPHAANVVFTDSGPVLIDWDTAKVAPRERDLWMINADGFAVETADRDTLRLYRAQWDLSELADYAKRFADPNDDGPEGESAWDDFSSYVERAAADS